MTDEQKLKFDLQFKAEWKELGFYYDFEKTTDKPEWRFFGSKEGLTNIIGILDKYVTNPANNSISEHEHYGPHIYLKIMTWTSPTITDSYIAGTIEDLTILKSIIAEQLSKAAIGDTFYLGNYYGIDNTADAKFIVMKNDFDPSSMDNWVWFDNNEKK